MVKFEMFQLNCIWSLFQSSQKSNFDSSDEVRLALSSDGTEIKIIDGIRIFKSQLTRRSLCECDKKLSEDLSEAKWHWL